MPIRCSRKPCATLASAALLLCISHLCRASAIPFASGSATSAISVTSVTFRSDGDAALNSKLEFPMLQVRDLMLGSESVPDSRLFSSGHTLTLSTVAEMLAGVARAQAPGLAAALAKNNVPGSTNTADQNAASLNAAKPNAANPGNSLDIFGGKVSDFGGELFALDPAALTSAAYEDPTPVRVELTASDAERLRLLLVGLGVFAALMLAAAGHRSSVAEEANLPPAPVRKPIVGKAWVQRGTTFRPPPKEGDRSSQPSVSSSEPADSAHRSAPAPEPSIA